MVTLNDLLAAVVGKTATPLIDAAEQPIVQREDGSWLVDASVSTDDLRELLGLSAAPERGRPRLPHRGRHGHGAFRTHSARRRAFQLERLPLRGRRSRWAAHRQADDRARNRHRGMTGGVQHEPRTTDLLRTALDTHPGDQIALGEFLDPLGERAFGFLLLALALPNFIPVPTGIGGVMGVLVVLIGLQMLSGFEHPWLPDALRRRALARKSVEPSSIASHRCCAGSSACAARA